MVLEGKEQRKEPKAGKRDTLELAKHFGMESVASTLQKTGNQGPDSNEVGERFMTVRAMEKKEPWKD